MLTHEAICSAVRKAASLYPITKAEYFGSYATGRATEASDLDLLVEFADVRLSILGVIQLKQFLEGELLKPVDVVETPIAPGAIISIGKKVKVL
jgi:predicted nucleotidyltransferase